MHEDDRIQATLRDVFGLDAFREGQREIIDTVLEGRDLIAVMPTGGGKSLCYQLPAMLLPGLTLVVSPLIALMKDQVDQLQAQGLPATLINSTLGPEEQQRRLHRAASGLIKLLYVAPERFRSSRFLQTLASTDVSLFAVDEAHCLSQWGHDFRPDYLRLPRAIAAVGRPPVAAFTATATSDVRQDIAKNLRLVEPETFFAGIDRENLFLRFEYPKGKGEHDQKLEIITSEINKHPGESGIIYASTRKNVEKVSLRLRALGVSVMPYHAGLDEAARTRAQEDFMSGASQIIVATNAFGMGVDKADIRFVVHHDFPGSVEAYYQEVGRAGRDGEPALCLTLFSERDRFIQDFFLEGSNPPREIIKRVHAFLCEWEEETLELTVSEISERLSDIGNAMAISTSLKILERFSIIDRGFRGESPARVRLKVDVERMMERLVRAPVQRAVVAALEDVVEGDLRAGASLDLGQLAYETGLTRERVSRVLAELGKTSGLEYEPPFRGRSTRVLIRDPELPIDWPLLEEKAKRDRQKIDTMIHFAWSGACRKWFLRRYFMDEGGAYSCGRCDRCLNSSEADLKAQARLAEEDLEKIRQGVAMRFQRRSRTPRNGLGGGPAADLSGDQLLLVRKVLSCVARMRGRFGRLKVAQVLKGSRDRDLLRWDLDRLSTYGLLADIRLDDIVAVIDALADAGFLRRDRVETAKGYSLEVIALSETGREAMLGKTPVAIPLPETLQPKENGEESKRIGRQGSMTKRYQHENTKQTSNNHITLSVSENRLYRALGAWRRKRAQAEGVPPYVIMNNETLRELSRLRPSDREGLLAVRGLGKTRVNRYGEALLGIILEHSRLAGP